MSNFADLLAQKAEIEKQIEAEKQRALDNAAENALAVYSEIGVPAAEAIDHLTAHVKASRKKNKSGGTPAPVKYRQISGEGTWSGKGRPPSWYTSGDYSPI